MKYRNNEEYINISIIRARRSVIEVSSGSSIERGLRAMRFYCILDYCGIIVETTLKPRPRLFVGLGDYVSFISS